MNDKVAILIPARYKSTRLRGKPLLEFNGKSMLRRIIESLRSSHNMYPIFVLTDDRSIAIEAAVYGAMPILEHLIPTDKPRNGTERCAYAAEYSVHLRPYVKFINVQGDMIDITLDHIETFINEWDSNEYSVATAWDHLDDDRSDFRDLPDDPNVVKCIIGNKEVRWCGRGFTYGDRHLGIYGYTYEALVEYPSLPSIYEEREGLEQLRWLENDYQMQAIQIPYKGMEINTKEDMKNWKEI